MKLSFRKNFGQIEGMSALLGHGRHTLLILFFICWGSSQRIRVSLAAEGPVPNSSPTAALVGAPKEVVREFQDTVERDFALRSIGELQITNARGDIVIEGWAQDRVRLRAVRRAKAQTLEEAKKLFAATDFRFRNQDRSIELVAEYGRGLKIEERLQERRNPLTSMDMTVLAPAALSLKVWAVSGKVIVKSWNSTVEVRTDRGPIRIESVKGGSISVLCPECSVTVKAVRASVRCMGGAGEIDLADVDGSQIYVESDSGRVRLSSINGEQLYVTKSGELRGDKLQGRIEFHSQSGNVFLTDGSGFLSGRSETGSISAKMTAWRFLDKALIESVAGSVSLELPSTFSGEVDLRSLQGKVASAFSVFSRPTKAAEVTALSSKPGSRLTGVVREGGEMLRLSSSRGDVTLLMGH